jgi:hypothetical protein
MMLEQVRYRTKLTQSGIFLVRYWTKIRDADAGVSFLDADAQLWGGMFTLNLKSIHILGVMRKLANMSRDGIGNFYKFKIFL